MIMPMPFVNESMTSDKYILHKTGSPCLWFRDWCVGLLITAHDWIFSFCSHGVDTSTFQEVEMEELMNQSLVYVGVDNMLAGLIYVEDRIRDDAAHVVNSLSSQGIGVYMLSGDKTNSAEYVASLVGIPKDKVRYALSRY